MTRAKFHAMATCRESFKRRVVGATAIEGLSEKFRFFVLFGVDAKNLQCLCPSMLGEALEARIKTGCLIYLNQIEGDME
ncbi:hypothetical protein [Xanthomonas arboricola]|uniref:hypothetical protein n=1 Tax=Xanthomonas arboricola TaxID=56448 RepID=UPI0015CC297A